MIHHISIDAQAPRRVAETLAELFAGQVSTFAPYPGSYIAWMGDDQGSAIEVLPMGTELCPDNDDGEGGFRHNSQPASYVATHAAISVTCDKSRILDLARRQGWRAEEFSRGEFRVIEFWIENRIMLELLTPEMAEEYRQATLGRRRKKP